MKVLMVSLDRKAFVPGDPARERLASYGKVFEELHIIVYAKRDLGLSEERIADNVWLYPTNSKGRLSYVLDAIRLARGRSVDIVSGQDLGETGVAAWRIARMLRVPLQLQDHADVFDPYFARESIGNRFRVLVARFLLPKADCIRTVLPGGKDRIIARFPSLEGRIEVLPVYTPTDALRGAHPSFSLHDRYPAFSRIFLMASRLVPQKDIGFALRAFAEADVEGSGLVLVGEGPLKDALMEEAVELGIEDRVVFVPWERDLVPYYKTADLFLLSSAYESYCRTLVEAAAAGLPFVSTDVGVASALVGSGAAGTVVAHGDHVAFRNAIRAWSESGKDAAAAGKGLAAVERLVGKDEDEYRARYRDTLARCAQKAV